MATEGCSVYYRFISCCDGTEIRFCRLAIVPAGTVLYTGDPVTGYGGTLQTGQCYTVSTASVIGSTFNYPLLTPFIAADLEKAEEGCDDPLCPDCPKKTVFTPCCGDAPISFLYEASFLNQFNAYQYPVGSPLIFGLGGVLLPGSCYAVSYELATPEELAVLTAGPVLGDVTYVGKFCENINPGVDCLPCNYYYQITNCADENEFYCTTSNLSAYINNLIVDPVDWPVIQVAEYPDKCFYVEQVATCAAPVPVNVTTHYIGCAPCQQTVVTYYELIDCNNPQVIIYTSTDLSEYIGQYITLEEYGDVCFFVSVADGLVPSDIPVTLTSHYATCETCSTQKYLLQDCTGTLPDVITITDLSAYIGEIIVLETCPDVCWSVEETDLSGDTEVTVINTFDTCEDCTSPPVPLCVSFTNKSGKAQEVLITDPDGAIVTLSVEPGTTSPKGCYLSWDIGTSLLTPVVYGDCVNNACPEVPQPKRKVTPGYNTPACTPEYYEKVECNFSEWMYKDVLEQRYGISNCCPEELMKWEIKHEMLMLDSLVNPDYSCQPPIDCGCPQPTTCNCSCNSGN
jgi:hypothetical protein